MLFCISPIVLYMTKQELKQKVMVIVNQINTKYQQARNVEAYWMDGHIPLPSLIKLGARAKAASRVASIASHPNPERYLSIEISQSIANMRSTDAFANAYEVEAADVYMEFLQIYQEFKIT